MKASNKPFRWMCCTHWNNIIYKTWKLCNMNGIFYCRCPPGALNNLLLRLNVLSKMLNTLNTTFKGREYWHEIKNAPLVSALRNWPRFKLGASKYTYIIRPRARTRRHPLPSCVHSPMCLYGHLPVHKPRRWNREDGERLWENCPVKHCTLISRDQLKSSLLLNALSPPRDAILLAVFAQRDLESSATLAMTLGEEGKK